MLMGLTALLRTKMATTHTVALLFAQLALAMTLINFYMMSILPEGTTTYSSPASPYIGIHKDHRVTMAKTAAPEFISSIVDTNVSIHQNDNENDALKSWVCARQIDSHVHGRRLSIQEQRKRVAHGFHREHPEPILYYNKKHHDTHSQQSLRRIHGELHPHNGLSNLLSSESNHKASKVAIGDRCEMYSCINQNGIFLEVESTTQNKGCAGKFIHRDKNVTKQQMARPGGASWASGCVISHKYKFIYIHVLKSGGTATKEFIRKSLCGEDDAKCRKVNKQIVQPYSCRMAVTQYPKYFTFTFVRDPFSRIYSMYSMMDGFPKRPNARGHVTDSLPFKDFVMMSPIERKQYTNMHPSHYYKQTDFLFSKGTCPTFDFLGRVEHFDQDMRTILQHLNAKDMLDYLDKNGGVQPANTWGSDKKKSLENGGLRNEYSFREINQVVDLYESDFELLGYDKEIPLHE